MKEIWKAHPKFKPYRVSNLGGVRVVEERARTTVHNGYVAAYIKFNGETFYYLVHKLVLETFVGSCPPGKRTRHLNDVKSDNRLSNLRWGTMLENHLDKRRNGIHRGFADLTSKERSAINIRWAAEKRRKGIPMGFAAMSKAKRKAAFKKGWVTRRMNLQREATR